MGEPYYAVARALDAASGDYILSGSQWKRESPMLSVAIRVLRTEKGTYLPDPTFGVDWKRVQKASPNAEAQTIAVITEALAYYVRRGLMTSLSVSAEARQRNLFYDVSFTDPRNNTRVTVPRQSL